MAKLLTNNGPDLDEVSTIASSVGAGSAGKVPHLDAAGLLGVSFIPNGLDFYQANGVVMPATLRTHAQSLNSSGTGYFVYLGTTKRAITVNYVGLWLSVNGNTSGGTPTAEVGLFSSPNPADYTLQTLTKIVSGATASLTSGASPRVLQNASSFGQAVAAGVHLWAGYRTSNNGGSGCQVVHGTGDMGRRGSCYNGSAAAFSGTSTYSTQSNASGAPGTEGPMLFAFYT